MDELEYLLLCHFTDNNRNKPNNYKGVYRDEILNLWQCEWLKIIDTPNVINFFQSNFNEYIERSELDTLIVAEAFLLAFTQENFTGPDLPEEFATFIEINWPKDVSPIKQLVVNAEEVNSNTRYPEFLLAAKLLLQKLDDSPKLIIKWWKIRFIFIYQSVLEELTDTLYVEFCSLSKSLLANMDQIHNIELKTLLMIEITELYIIFHHITESEKLFENITTNLGIELNIEGLLGYRTKFQERPLSQLCLKVYQQNDSFLSAEETNGNTKLPKLLELNDEVRLEKIRFLSEKDNQTINLSSIVQTLILSRVKHLLRSQPKDYLAVETFQPYLISLLNQEYGPFGIRLSVLFLNIKQESNHKRTVERSLKQCEEILNIIGDFKYSVYERFSYGFASFLAPKWEIQKQLGDLMSSLGLIKTALDLYTEIQAWENVIDCYSKLDLRHKASEIIRQELKKKESVKLYCLLGDTTNDPNCYEIAWKLSKQCSGRAQRHWGSYYFKKKEYEKALQHLEKSLQINSLQEVMWLKLGYSALMLEKWEIAVQAYLRYTYIEPNGFESWNNLAKALVKLGDKKRAHKILKEALKCNFNSWKIWENFMVVSIDTGNFEDAINAYNRLIELKEKERYMDLEVLEILVSAIEKNIVDAQGRKTNHLRKKVNELLAHQCIMHANEPKLWEVSARVAENSLSKVQKLQKLYQTLIKKNSSWSKNFETCLQIMNVCKDLCECTLKAVDNQDYLDKLNSMSQLSSARLIVQGCVRVVENNTEVCEEVRLLLKQLKFFIEKMTEKIKRHK